MVKKLEDLDSERARIGEILATGLETDWQTRAYDNAQITAVIRRLLDLTPEDLEGKLRVSGFTLTPYMGTEGPELEQSCFTCMYYEPHGRYCYLPELDVPVEPQWSCNLWRI